MIDTVQDILNACRNSPFAKGAGGISSDDA